MKEKQRHFRINKPEWIFSSRPRFQEMIMASWINNSHYKAGNLKDRIVYCITSKSKRAIEDYWGHGEKLSVQPE